MPPIIGGYSGERVKLRILLYEVSLQPRVHHYYLYPFCHPGGPLHLADIEDSLSLTTGQSTPCIICPWHKWCFDLSTGRQLDPLGREQHIQSYPVRVDSDTGTISIGFASFDSSCFTDYDFQQECNSCFYSILLSCLFFR